MIIDKNFVYIHMPKTGGTWMRQICRMLPTFFRETQKHEFLRSIAPADAGKPVYVHVRNPWDWYVSMYVHWNTNYTERIHEFIHPRDQWSEGTLWLEHVFGSDFATCVERYGSAKTRMEAARAKSYAKSFNRLIHHPTIEPTVLRFEDGLEEQAIQLFLNVGINLDPKLEQRIRGFGRANAAKNRKPYREYYTDETRQLVAEREKELIDRFQYTF